MKTAVVCLLVLAVLAAVSAQGYYNQTRIMGNIGWGDRLLDREWALKPAKRGKVQVHNYKYPRFGWGSNISYIKVLDKWANGTNGDLYLNSGGVGARSVSMSIRSRVGYGLQYDIEVWGR